MQTALTFVAILTMAMLLLCGTQPAFTLLAVLAAVSAVCCIDNNGSQRHFAFRTFHNFALRRTSCFREPAFLRSETNSECQIHESHYYGREQLQKEYLLFAGLLSSGEGKEGSFYHYRPHRQDNTERKQRL